MSIPCCLLHPLRRRTSLPGRRSAGGMLLLVLILALVGACGDSTGPAIATPVGLWSGTSEGITLRLLLAPPERGSFSGSGTITTPTRSHSVTATGTHVHPHVSLTLMIGGFEDINFQGQFEGRNEIVGTLNGSGFADLALTLQRQ